MRVSWKSSSAGMTVPSSRGSPRSECTAKVTMETITAMSSYVERWMPFRYA